jgi:hypothetical protein
MGEANITINSTIEYIKNNTFNMIKEGENVENIQSLNLQNQTESQRNFYTIVFLIITLALIIKKLCKINKINNK